jgi:hypothetical protein
VNRRALALLLPVLALGCSDDGADDRGNGGANGSNGNGVADACGPVVQSVGNECTTSADCSGRPGQPNILEARCENCVPFAQINLCEAGTCRRVEVDNDALVEVAVEGNFLTDGAEGYADILMTSLTADGRRVSCDELLTTCDWRDPRLAVFNSNGGPATSRFPRNQQTFVTDDSIEGDDLIMLVLITDGAQGRGRLRTVGCVDGVEARFRADGMATRHPEAMIPLTDGPPDF